MSLYHVVEFYLLLGAAIEFRYRKTPKFILITSYAILTIMLGLRFGQGTDYFGYMRAFDLCASFDSYHALITANMHEEIGWRTLCYVFGKLGLSFSGLILVLALFGMKMLWDFISKYSPAKMLSLFLTYPTLYLTYMFSGLRQGVVLCAFFGVLLDLYTEKKYKRYMLGVLLLATIHSAAIALAILPLFRDLSKRTIIIALLASWTFGLIGFQYFNTIIKKLLNAIGVGAYSISTAFHLSGILERIISFVIIFWFYSRIEPVDEDNVQMREVLRILIRIYTTGMIIYGATIWQSIISGRLTACMKLLEIAIVSLIVVLKKRNRKILFILFLALSLAMYVKNIDAYITQGQYYSNVTSLNYPYVSVLNKDDIYDYRPVSYTFDSD